MADEAAPSLGLSQGSRDDIKGGCLTAGMLMQVFAKRTKTPVDDKFARLLIAAGTTDQAILDKFIDLFDSTVL